jgi:hypothetical protein
LLSSDPRRRLLGQRSSPGFLFYARLKSGSHAAGIHNGEAARERLRVAPKRYGHDK